MAVAVVAFGVGGCRIATVISTRRGITTLQAAGVAATAQREGGDRANEEEEEEEVGVVMGFLEVCRRSLLPPLRALPAVAVPQLGLMRATRAAAARGGDGSSSSSSSRGSRGRGRVIKA